MQVIPIIWPILLCAFITGLLLGWVLFVALPRLRRADGRAWLRRVAPRNSSSASPTPGSRIVDTDQPATRRNV